MRRVAGGLRKIETRGGRRCRYGNDLEEVSVAGRGRAAVDDEPSVGRECYRAATPSLHRLLSRPALEGEERERDASLPASKPATEGA